MSEHSSMEEYIVSGTALNENEAKITVNDIPNRPGVAGLLFSALAARTINVDMIVQSSSTEGINSISFTVDKTSLSEAREILEHLRDQLNYREVAYDDAVSKVSIVGAGMRSHPGVAARMFSCLGRLGINIDIISTSEIKISCIVSSDDGARAVRAIHGEFHLGSTPETTDSAGSGSETRTET